MIYFFLNPVKKFFNKFVQVYRYVYGDYDMILVLTKDTL